MNHLRLLHTSDVHLGGLDPPADGRHRDHCLCPLTVIERLVVTEAIDVMLVAGDLFDHQRVSSELVAEVLGRLGNLGAPCAVISGNHDVHDDSSVYDVSAVDESGVVFFDDHDGKLADLLDGRLAVWAKAMAVHDRSFRPLQGVPPRPSDQAWWVVMAHGHYEPEAQDRFGRSSPLSPEDVAATGADYVALGHWHIQSDISTDGVAAWYSGAPYGAVSSGRMNVIDLHPERGVTVSSVPVELPAGGCHVDERSPRGRDQPGEHHLGVEVATAPR